MVETDNMAAQGSASKCASKAPDMQELLRRLLRECERWGIHLKVSHTPGEKLYRPDQTSRGDPVEEPRVRLAPDSFATIERRWGPFHGLVGPEREFAKRPSSSSSCRKLWFHPTYNTVGTALRMAEDRLAADLQSTEATVVVPTPFAPSWANLLKHGRKIGLLSSEGLSREMCVAGKWRQLLAGRPAAVFRFPRASGAFCYPLRLAVDDATEWAMGESGLVASEAYTPMPSGEGF